MILKSAYELPSTTTKFIVVDGSTFILVSIAYCLTGYTGTSGTASQYQDTARGTGRKKRED
jgi:hypothetical protein